MAIDARPSLKAIEYALDQDTHDGLGFLRAWYESNWTAIKEEWPSFPIQHLPDYDPEFVLLSPGEYIVITANE